MKNQRLKHLLTLTIASSAAILALSSRADLHARIDDDRREPKGPQLATGQFVTPMFVKGAVQQYLNPGLADYPNFVAGEAVRSQLSPDGTTLAIITAGQNSLDKPDGTTDTANSTQFIFLYNVDGANKTRPVLQQVIRQTNAHVGLVFSPDGNTLYAAGGADDKVYVYAKAGGAWTAAAPIALGHANKGVGLSVRPNASGMDVSADGSTLVVANNYNDSISVIDTATRQVRYEHDLRPFAANNEGTDGAVGGTFPFAVVMKGNGVAYVSSDRDREVVVVDVSSPVAGHLIKRIKLDGNALGMTLDQTQSRLYVAQDNADEVAVIDTSTNTVKAKIDARAPAGMLPGPKYTGAATFAVTLSRDGRTLYAVNSGANSIAVIPLTGRKANTVSGLIPTAYEPHDVTFSADGSWMYIVNGKSLTGPNPGHLTGSTASITSITYPGGNAAAAVAAKASNQYQFQLERASLVSAPVPSSQHLWDLTARVAANNSYFAEPNGRDREVMEFLHRHIKHVIYIVKENRTYDQVLGDLSNGAHGDPNLTQFGQSITPNNHRLATDFVTLDNFMNPGDGSMDGWSWSLQGRVTNTETITQQINYAFVNRGLSYESEGANRNVPVNFGTVAERDAAAGVAGTTNYSNASASLPGGTANLLAGTGNHASSDAPFGIQDGYIFDAVLHAGGTRAQLRLPREQHREHRHDERAGVRSVRRRRRSGGAPRPGAGAAHRRLLPRLRPEVPGPVALQRMETGVRSVRRQSKPAEPLARSHQPRPHGQLHHGARRPGHARNAAGGLRPGAGPAGRGRREQPLRRRHPDRHHRRRRSGRSRPHRFAPWAGLRHRALREAPPGRQHTLQPGERAAHDRGRARHRAHQPEHRPATADGRCVRHPFLREMDVCGRGVDRARDHHDRFSGGSWRREVRRGADRQAQARRGVLGQGHGRLRFRRSRRGARRSIQPSAVEGPHGRHAVPGAAWPGRGHEGSGPLS